MRFWRQPPSRNHHGEHSARMIASEFPETFSLSVMVKRTMKVYEMGHKKAQETWEGRTV